MKQSVISTGGRNPYYSMEISRRSASLEMTEKIVVMKKLLLLTSAFCLSAFAFSQEYGWVDISNSLPDTQYDTIYNGLGDTTICYLTDVFFLTDSVGWVTTDQPDGTIFHTKDAGHSWEIQNGPCPFSKIKMIDSLKGYAGGYSNGGIYKTIDGCNSWQYLGSIGGNVVDIQFPANSDTGYAIANSGQRFYKITPNGLEMFSILTGSVYGLSSTSEGVYIIDGPHIKFWKDGNYTEQGGDDCGYYSDISFINNDYGWATNNCKITGYTGNKIPGMDIVVWVAIYSEDYYLSSNFTCLFALNKDSLCVGDNQGRIMFTSNASDFGYDTTTCIKWSNVNWETQMQPTGKWLRTIQFPSKRTGYAVGNKKAFFKYTELSETDSTNATLTTINIDGIPLDNFNSNIYDSTVELPSGTTEIPQLTATTTVSAATVNITQASTLPGTATIVVTAKDGVTQQTYTIHFTVVTGIEDFKETFEFEIYPNPTASVVSLQSAVFSQQPAVVEIYDLNGRKHLEKQIPAGSNEIEVDVNRLNSGVYYCKIVFANKSVTRKIIIRK